MQEEVLQDWHSLCQKICKLVKLQRKPYPGPWDKIGACQGDLRICCILVPGLQRYLLPLVPRLHCYGDGIDANDGLVGTEWQFCSGTCLQSFYLSQKKTSAHKEDLVFLPMMTWWGPILFRHFLADFAFVTKSWQCICKRSGWSFGKLLGQTQELFFCHCQNKTIQQM